MRPWAGPSAGDTVGRHGDTAQNRAHQCSATYHNATPVPGRLAAEKGPEAVHSRHIARNAGPPICLIALPSPRLIARLSPGAGSRSCPNVLLHCSSDPSCPVVHAAALLTYIQGPHHVRDFAQPPQKNSHRPLPLSQSDVKTGVEQPVRNIQDPQSATSLADEGRSREIYTEDVTRQQPEAEGSSTYPRMKPRASSAPSPTPLQVGRG
jgi:hypothetical protein